METVLQIDPENSGFLRTHPSDTHASPFRLQGARSGKQDLSSKLVASTVHSVTPLRSLNSNVSMDFFGMTKPEQRPELSNGS